MGTTLTGTTPQDTYDSLIKVTDNGPISGTAKYLSDGLGNDSALALSTAGVGIGTTNPSEKLDLQGTMNMNAAGGTYLQVQYNGANRGYMGTANAIISGGATTDFGLLASSDLLFGTGGSSLERMRITSAGNVGIGTSTPDTKLQVAGTGATGLSIRANTSGDAFMRYYLDTVIASDAYVDRSTGNLNIRTNQNSSAIVFSTSAALIERVRITDNGLTFNGDTAAANALDDYEEGTWTMGVTFGGASVDVTTSSNTGSYTKIGRQVTLSGYLQLTSKGSSSGVVNITGLPFTIPNLNQNYSAPSLWCRNITFANQYAGLGEIGTNGIALVEMTEAGVETSLTNADFANNSAVILSFTYFV